MENQQNKKYLEELLGCRNKIDKIDEEILTLLQKRMQIVGEVREIKSQNGEDFFIKSAREADMIKALVSRYDGVLPKSTIIGIWRKIIVSANMMEQPLKIALHNPRKIADYNYILREYYADFVPIVNHDSVANTALDIEKKTAQIAAFALPKSDNDNSCENWWINLANNKSGIKVFAKIPFVSLEDAPNLALLAIKEQERSSADNSLFCIEVSTTISKSQLLAVLKEIGIDAKILKTTQLKAVNDLSFHLVEADGFYDEKSDEVLTLAKHKIRPFVKVLGVYPKNLS